MDVFLYVGHILCFFKIVVSSPGEYLNKQVFLSSINLHHLSMSFSSWMLSSSYSNLRSTREDHQMFLSMFSNFRLFQYYYIFLAVADNAKIKITKHRLVELRLGYIFFLSFLKTLILCAENLFDFQSNS